MAHDTNCSFLHIIIIIIIIHIFLFHTASTNLIVHFPLKHNILLASTAFLKVLFYNPFQPLVLVISASLYNEEAIKIHTKQPCKEHLLHYQLSKPSCSLLKS